MYFFLRNSEVPYNLRKGVVIITLGRSKSFGKNSAQFRVPL